MKKILRVLFVLVLLTAFATLPAMAQTTFFSDDFTAGSTLTNQTPAYPTTNSAAYQLVSSKNWSPAPSLKPHDLKFGIAATTSGNIEVQAVFTTNAIVLTQVGDYVQLTVVFTNTAGLLAANNTLFGFGLYNSGGSYPVAGGLYATATSGNTSYATGGVQIWQGYVGQIEYSGNANRIMTRPAQTGSNDTGNNRNQDLVTSGSGSSSYSGATTVGSTVTSAVTLVNGGTYTEVLTITLNGANSLAITNALYSGADTNGALLTQFGGIATNATYLTSGFDGLAIGWRETANQPTTIDISSITVSGSVTAISSPPTITTQPLPVIVATNGSCAFVVAANGFDMTYQWHRHGTNLLDGGNISGATSPMLVISPAGPADVASAANGYYVTVSGAGGYSTNSVTNSLTLIPATNLIYSGSGPWDLNTSPSWLDTNYNSGLYFNFGDPVTFNDIGGGGSVTLNGPYLSAASVTVSHTSSFYTFQGSGSFAGPGYLLYSGSGLFTINNANTFSGGTIISNANAYLRLGNLNGLGTGPITFAQAGGQMEIIPTASSSTGIANDLVVADDFTIIVDATNAAYGVVLNGNLSGTTGKTLTLNHSVNGIGTTATRIRAAGVNTVYNGNLVLGADGDPNFLWAFYQPSGSQTYNGVISGPGALMAKSAITYLNGANTFAGGTLLASGAIGLGADSTGPAGAPATSPLGTGPLLLTVDSTTSTTGTGWLFASGGPHTIGNAIQYPTGTNNLTLAIGGTNDLTFTGPFTLNGNDNVTSASITARTVQVTNTGLTTFSGVISDGGLNYGLIKTGNGTLALTAAETYTGPTLVSGGTLLVNGSLSSSSAVTVTNGLLGGTGTVGGTVTVQRGGGLAPGANGIGTLTINNALTLQGGSTNYFEVNKGAGTRDFVLVGNNVTYGGTLVVTNLSGTITTSDTFAIFGVSGSSTGNFTNLLGSPGPGLAWRFNPTNGVLSVVTGIASNPTNLAVSVSGGNINLSWPADHTGWTLQAQTNNLSAGLGTNWVDVAGSTATNQVIIPINPTNPSVFYRLIYRP